MQFNLPNKLSIDLHRTIRAKLIFNPASGQQAESPQQLVNILLEMQNQMILPEVYTVRPESCLEEIVNNAIKSGIKLIVVAGGDGTIDNVVGAMVGKDVTLGIIPTGTRNNVAYNLGIPQDIASAVALLRQGRRIKIDVGRIHVGHSRRWFLEGVAMGLISDLYPMADDLQHGNLTQIGGFLSTLVSATPSTLKINFDGQKLIAATTHMVLIANMSYVGPHFQISPEVSFKDSHLDVFTFSEMSKLNVITYAVLPRGSLMVDAINRHYRVKYVKITSKPKMSILADGVILGEGSFSVQIHPRALKVMAGAKLTGQPSVSQTNGSRKIPDE